MFCVASQTALKPQALAISAGVYFVVSTVAASLAIAIATDPEGQQAVADFFYQCSDKVKEKINEYARGFSVGAMMIIECDVEGWQMICDAVYDYFVTDKGSSSINYALPEIENDNNLIGFTKDSKFSFTVSNGAPFAYTTVLLGRSTLTLGGAIKASELRDRYPDMFPYAGDLSNQVTFRGVEIPVGISIELTDNDGFKYVYIYYGGMKVVESNPDSIFDYSGTYTSLVSSPSDSIHRFSCDNSNYSFSPLEIGLYSSDVTQSPNPGYFNTAFYDSSGNRYSILKNENDKYVFMRTTGELYYDGKEFDTSGSAMNYFLNQCGFTLPNNRAGTYTPGDTRADSIPGVTVKDPANSKQRLDDMNAINADSINVALPGTNEMLEELEANPDAVIVDDSAMETYPDIYTGVYSGDVKLPTVDSNSWKDKFPFCLPFDIIRLFTAFKAEAEAPKFDLLLMPEKSFGLDNEAFYITIDFSEEGYNSMVQMMRFFFAIGFVVWLISISRKMTGSGG